MDDNLSRQVEEIETLCSIYGSDWMTEDEARRAYSYTVKENKRNATLYVTLPGDYPGNSPPTYELFAPELSSSTKYKIASALDEVYLDNVGEPVLYQWVEKLRELLEMGDEHPPPCDSGDACLDLVTEMEQSTQHCSSLVAVPTAFEAILVKHGPVITDRKSVFQGHAAIVHSTDQVQQVLAMLKQNKKIAHATHNIFAYRIARDTAQETFIQDCEDDGETQAGGRLLHLLQVVGAINALIVVSRWYGGIQLGPDRFRHINNAARQALDLAGLIPTKRKATH